KLAGDKAIGGIDSIILTLSSRCLITRLLDGKRLLLDSIVLNILLHLQSGDSGFNAKRAQAAQYFVSNLLIRLEAVDSHATHSVRVKTRGHAGVTDVTLARILHVQLTTTVSAS